jgi:hypothetical protein
LVTVGKSIENEAAKSMRVNEFEIKDRQVLNAADKIGIQSYNPSACSFQSKKD